MTSTRLKPRFALPACLTALLAASLTACNSSAKPPALARADAAPLVALANSISREDACAQRRDIQTLQRHAVALVNTGRVPEELQEPLLSGIGSLTAAAPPCVPAVPVQPTPPQPTPEDHGHGHGHGHGNGHDQGQGNQGDGGD